MKIIQKVTFFIALVALFVSCQSSTDVSKILTNQETKQAIMETIANDSILSVEMMGTMMNSKMMMGNERMTSIMMQNQGTMLKMMQNNPVMMQSMMTGMMETFKGDTAMMSSMGSIMLENPQMMNMMQKNIGGNMDNMNGMNHKMK